MIKTLPYSHMRVDEYYTLSMQVVALLKPHTEEAQLSVLHTSIASAISKVDQAFLKLPHKGLTLSVKEADSKRDRLFKAFRYYVEACLFRGKTEWGNAPELLIEVIRLLGWTLYSDSYGKETARLNQLFNEIDTNPELSEAIATIAATDLYNELKESQVNFENVFKSRNEANATLPNVKTEDAVVELRRLLQVLMKYVESMAMMNSDPKYTGLCKEFNELIAPIQAAVNTRKSKPEVAEEELPQA
ncbi:DUF6261 family protein [Marinifilum fragile]|uniref:DUF6261 family protein n=1 Tax=Marinifilum fragile TaxID=570161 RepID=UPI002AA6B925|nr:DUF6261 family protein [Marinifilum fragile]